jgi:hypothetical protein
MVVELDDTPPPAADVKRFEALHGVSRLRWTAAARSHRQALERLAASTAALSARSAELRAYAAAARQDAARQLAALCSRPIGTREVDGWQADEKRRRQTIERMKQAVAQAREQVVRDREWRDHTKQALRMASAKVEKFEEALERLTTQP